MSRRETAHPDTVRLVYPAKIEFLPLLNAVTEQILGLAGADEETGVAVANAVMEAGTNAAQYGGEGTDVEVEFRIGDLDLDVVISDRGSGFEPESTVESEEGAGTVLLRGRGIEIMRAVMDEVRFEGRSGGGTTVRLRKRLEKCEA